MIHADATAATAPARRTAVRRYVFIGVFLAAWIALVSIQLFIPPFIGIANNGDFAKVTGRLCMADVSLGEDNQKFFQPNYLRGVQYCWNFGTLSSELALASVASTVERALGPRDRFDIRWLGALHAGLCALFMLLLFDTISALPPRASLPLAGAALWMFTDVSLVANFNSFFTDTAAVLGALLMTILAVRLTLGRYAGYASWIAYALSALLFITSKAQHAPFGLAAIAFAAVGVVLTANRAARYLAAATAAVLLAATAWMLATMHPDESGQARFTVIFSKITPNAASRTQDLEELGLPAEYIKYVGMNAYSPGSPASGAWLRDFAARANTRRMLRFYLRHPIRTRGFLWDDLRTSAWTRRQLSLSNFQRWEGHPRGTGTDRFTSWSKLRGKLFVVWPGHILMWYSAVTLGGVLLARARQPRIAPLASLCIGVAAVGAGELVLVSLADAAETDRHLFLFHIFTDLTMLFALAFALTRKPNLPSWLKILRRPRAILVLVCIIAALPRIYLGATQYIEYDGYWHVFIAMQDRWKNLWHEYKVNFHPPLYYLLLKGSLLFGRSHLAYRAISILCGLGAVFAIGMVAAKLSRWRATSAIAALAFGLALPSIIISGEVRAYALCTLFVLLSLYYFLDVIEPARNTKSRVIFAVCAMLAVSSEYAAYFYIFGCGLVAASLGLLSMRAGYVRRLALDAATFAPAAAAGAYLYVTHAGTHAIIPGHLKQFYWNRGGESAAGFLLGSSQYLFNAFSPFEAATRAQFAAVLVALLVAAGLTTWLLRRRAPEDARAAAVALIGLVILGCMVAGGLTGKYPFGGFLRQQYILFPFAALWGAVLLDRLVSASGRPRVRAAAAVAATVAIVTVSAVKFYRFPKVRTEIGTAEVERFREAFPSPQTIYLDQYNLILFFIHYNDWTWHFVHKVPGMPWIDIYRASKDGRQFTVVRDERWSADLTDATLYRELASVMRSESLPSLTIFRVSQFPSNAGGDPAAAIAQKMRSFAPAAGLSVRKASLVADLTAYVELAPGPPAHTEMIAGTQGCDDTDDCVTYSEKWLRGTFAGAVNGTLTYTAERGALARATFTGTSVRYVYTKAFNRGFASVAIDGVEKAVIDLYSPRIEWQSSTTFSGLSPGKHTIEIRVLGRHRPASSGDAVDVDAILTP